MTVDLSWMDEAQAVMDAAAACPRGKCWWMKPAGMKIPILCLCDECARD